jgi:hypothetical protein
MGFEEAGISLSQLTSCAALLIVLGGPAEASFVIDIYQAGGNVMATYPDRLRLTARLA